MLKFRSASSLAVAALFMVGASPAALAHCDTLDGPVVAAARLALDQNDPNLVLIWVSEDNEKQIKSVFDKALSVRKLNPAAKDMADMYFFETLVRLHRAGEGAPYTGLKPAGTDLGPAVPAADNALTTGNVGPVAKLLIEALETGLHEHFDTVQARKNYDKNDVSAGREYVEAYVSYVHYVESLYDTAKSEAQGHYEERASADTLLTACNAN